MYLLWFITIVAISLLHSQFGHCDDLGILSSIGLGGVGIGNGNGLNGGSIISSSGSGSGSNGNGNVLATAGINMNDNGNINTNTNNNNYMILNGSLLHGNGIGIGNGNGNNNNHNNNNNMHNQNNSNGSSGTVGGSMSGGIGHSSGVHLGGAVNLGGMGGAVGTMPMSVGGGGGGGGGVGSVGGGSGGISGRQSVGMGIGLSGTGGGRMHHGLGSHGTMGGITSIGSMGSIGGRMGGMDIGMGNGMNGMSGGSLDYGGMGRMGGGQNPYFEHFISEHTVMAVFTSQGQVGGPCRFMPATRRQNHQCRKEFGLPDTIREARRLATTYCEDKFRYDRWNCSIETRGKRHIFKKLYKETAFVHALTAAAMTHSIARACAEGRMTKCSCGPRKQNRVDQDFQWGGCNDNLKHGKRVTRSFLDLRDGYGDEVTEILRHDSEVGIEAVSTLMKDKCKCHGVSGSCSMRTCWKKLSDFNATATLLREKYNQAIRKAPNTRTMRREAPTSRMKRPKQRRKKQQSQYTTLYYLETSPSYCSVTKDRQCRDVDNCANLCCGRGYTTRVFKQVEKCRCRFKNGRCCDLICDYCQSYEDRYFCK